MIIGLTGGLASGKTTIACLLQKNGYLVIDADDITHELYDKNEKMIQIVKHICPLAINDNAINRKILATCVVQKPNLLSLLEEKTHPIIMDMLNQKIQIALKQSDTVILVAPLLFETGLDSVCDMTICLYADMKTQHERAMLRSHMTEDKFTLLINRQWNNQKRISHADYAISTDTSIETTYQSVISCFHQIQQETL
ncbi:MAG: dephospho-CoA kinase [Alphaproteobacteria bacterium]|nr:dephospho-CoA kinase [Alphaproteobacteria bacterium]